MIVGASCHDGDTDVEANLYTYAINNPVMNSDLDGHSAIDTRFIAGFIGGK